MYAEELERLEQKLRDALERLENGEKHVPSRFHGAPSPDPRLRRLQRNVAAVSRAYERLKNGWFPPEYADCVEGFDMCRFGPNEGKIRPYRSRGPWRAYPTHPLDEAPPTA
jgi:hypothetical protein